MAWSVCIFAKNEERTLPRALAALGPAAAGAPLEIHIMVNGSTDSTARVARAFAAADPRIRVHELLPADKAHAWNDYARRIAPADAEMHIFMDADSYPTRGAFRALRLALESEPRALAAAGLPAAGASRLEWAMHLYTEHYLSGDLYALSRSALRRIRTEDIALPAGAIGEDGILSYLLVTDLKGGDDDTRRERIAVAAGAFFEFDPLTPTPAGLRAFARRLIRAAQKRFQHQLLFARLKRHGVAAMPHDIRELYTPDALRELHPRADPVGLFIDRLALRELMRRTTA